MECKLSQLQGLFHQEKEREKQYLIWLPLLIPIGTIFSFLLQMFKLGKLIRILALLIFYVTTSLN